MPHTLVAIAPAPATRWTAAMVAILVLYLLARIIQVLPFTTPSPSIVALEILSALAFAIVHGTRTYELRGILVFSALCILIGGTIECIGVHTGFPYGRYEFFPLMGPQLLRVPVLLGLAYIGMAYTSWMLACAILPVKSERRGSAQLIAIPVLASLIMTAWDFAQDPVWSTLLHGWQWRDGGVWFGVPLTNYAGWLLTVFLIYLSFSLYLRRSPSHPSAPADARFAIALYALCALGNVLQSLRPQPFSIVADPAGTLWHTAGILRASAFVSVFFMGSFAWAAWLRMEKPDLQING